MEFPGDDMSTALLARIASSLVEGDPDATVAGVREAIAAGLEPLAIIDGALVVGMRTVGDKYASGEFFLPNLIV
jgi:5-methyltetrahydrofolate--homocysteine methyltransferase